MGKGGEGCALSDNETKRKAVSVQMTALRSYPQGQGYTTPIPDGDDIRGCKKKTGIHHRPSQP